MPQREQEIRMLTGEEIVESESDEDIADEELAQPEKQTLGKTDADSSEEEEDDDVEAEKVTIA